MNMNWNEFAISAIGDVIGGGTPSTKHNEYYGDEIAWITPKDLSNFNGRYISRGERSISQKGYDNSSAQMMPTGTVLFSSRTPIGYVAIAKNELCTNQGFKSVVPHPEICDSEFLYYLLCYRKHDIEAIASGTTFMEVSGTALKNFVVHMPDISTQKKIASVLSSLDQRIEGNNLINHNLEEQAKCLVKSWFVDFEPYGGQIPDSWHEITLSEIADFIGGYSYKGTELQPSSCAMATIKNFDRTGGFKLDGYKEIIPSDKLKDSQKVELFDILVAHTDLTQKAEVIGNAEMVLSKSGYDEIIMSMDLVKVLPKHGISRFVLAALLRTDQFKDHALGYVNGTTVLHMSKKALPAFTLYFPEKFSELSEISCMLEAIYKKIAQNIEESRSLVKLRDTLLPKLMSGELDISEVQV